MNDVVPTARINLLAAKDAPFIVILRRKPSKTYHVIRWNVEQDEFEHGSWFTGRIYERCTDVSFDGKWMVYLARGARGATWNGVCLLPFLKTYIEADAPDTWGGGGYFRNSRTLITDSWMATKGDAPFQVENGQCQVYEQRMKRDGWIHDESKKRWFWQFHPRGSMLEATYHRHSFDCKFRLRDFPDLLDQEVEWSTFAANGDLVVARLGWVYRYSPSDLSIGKPGFASDLNGLTREKVGAR